MTEGGTVALGISASAGQADQNSPSILISGVPSDATLSAGTNNHDGTWTLTAEQLSGLNLIAGEEGTAALTVTVTDTEQASSASATKTIALTVSPPSITVGVTGTPQEGETLSANATVSNGDALGFEWQSSTDGQTWTAIAGATSQNYVVQEGYEGRQLRAVAVLSDDGYSVASDATNKVIDAAPTITTPTITSNDAAGTNTLREGDILTASAHGRSDDTVAYQWFSSADGYQAAIGSGATYTIKEGDEGFAIKAVATSTNDDNVGVSSSSDATTAVRDVLPAVSVPIIGGLVQDGQTITASATAGGDADDSSVSFTWYSSKDNYTSPIGAGSTYLLGEHDEGSLIKVQATVTNENGETASAFSAPSVPVAENPNEPLAVTVTAASGSVGNFVFEGVPLIAQAVDIDDPPTYQWQRSPDGQTWTDIPGATSDSYTPGEADENQCLREISTLEDGGVTTTGEKDVGIVIPVSEPPSVSVPPAITVNEGGSAQLPISITPFDSNDDARGSTVTITGLPTDVALSAGTQNQDGSWTVQTSDLPNLSMTVASEAVGTFQITVSATAIDATTNGFIIAPAIGHNAFTLTILPEQPSLAGTAASVSVAEFGTAALPVSLVGADADDVLSVTISGLPAGASLSAGTLNPDGSWTLTPDQLANLQITVGDETTATLTVTASNSEGGLTASSSQSIALNITEASTAGSVTITGLAKEGQTLTANASSSDPDASFTYQWQSSADNGVTWTAISGATAQTYTVQEGDENNLIDVVATAHDQGAADVGVTSAATSKVVDNSSITVSVSLPGGNPVQEGQQLVATAIIGETDDANAVVAYQWQVSSDGGNTWSNTTSPTTSALASGVPSSFYQLTEADEGNLFRAVASFTDDTGQLVSSAPSAPTVAVADVAPAITVPFNYAVDELKIVKNGTPMLDDTFASAPPVATAVTDPAGSAPVNFVTLGSTWSDANHKAIMASAGAVVTPGGGGAQVIARLNTSTLAQGTGAGQSDLGLKQDASFTVSGTFDLSAPSPVNAFYGIDLTDGSPSKNPADQVVQLVLKKTGTTGGGTYAVQLIQNNQATSTVTVLAQQDITAQMAGNTQIEFDLSHAANSSTLTGSFELLNNGTQTASTTFAPATAPSLFINGVTYTRAEMLAFAPQAVTISGLAQDGRTLTANAAANDADATLHYQWQRSTSSTFTSGVTNIGSDSSTYTLQESDEGNFIRVRVNSTGTDGTTSGNVFSGASAQVTDAPISVSNVLVNGLAAGVQPHEGDSLTATATVSSSEAVLHYQWQESADPTFATPSAITNIGTDNDGPGGRRRPEHPRYCHRNRW